MRGSAPDMQKSRLGAIQVALAATSWSFAGVFSKSLPWNSFTINGVRSLAAALLLALARGGFRVKLTQDAMPVFVILFSWVFYGQKPGLRHVVIAACIMAGVVLCSWDGLAAGNPLGDAIAILSAVTFALVFFCARMPGADPRDYSYLGLLMCAPFALNACFDPGVSANPVHWLIALGLGVCLAGGYFFISLSMRNVSPISAALLSNLEPILNPFWVFLFLGERPGPHTLVGSAIVLAAATVYALLPVREDE